MMYKKMTVKMAAGLMAAVMLITSMVTPAGAFAAKEDTGEGKTACADTLPLFMEVADQLDPGEAVSAEDIEVTAGDGFDPAEDYTGITYDRDKVKIHYCQAVDADGKEFSTKRAGKYTAVYYAEALSSHHDYRFTRKVTVKEKNKAGAANVSEAATEGKGESGKDSSGNGPAKEEEGSEDGSGSTEHSGSKETEGAADPAAEAEKPADSTGSSQASGEDTEAGQETEAATEAGRETGTDTADGNGEADELKESAASSSKADQLSYNILYVRKYGNKDYIDVENLDYASMVFPVTVVRGLATYNVKKQKDFEVTNNFIAGMTYSLPVYDVDEKSDYYVAMPDVNLYSKELASYDITVIYNNDYAEKIDGYHYDKKILYVPKSVVDHPKNQNPLYDGGPLAVQLNYAFGGIDADKEGNADFGKTLPVQILDTKKAVPESKSVRVENVFDESVLIPDVVRDGKSYSKDDFSLFLNGMMVPVDDGVWDYEDGTVVIHSSPAIISNVNIVYDGKGVMSKALSFIDSLFSVQVNAQANGERTTTADMKVYKNKDKKVVTLNFDTSKMYVGWRGTFKSRVLFAPHVGEDNYNTVKNLENYDELENSTYYLYGGYTPNHNVSDSDWQWAIESYTIGKNKAEGVADSLSRDKLIERNEGENSDQKLTIYQWFIKARNNLEKAVNHFGAGTSWGQDNGSDWYVHESDGSHTNGIGGDTNFAFRVPKKVTGSSVNLVSAQSNPGYGSGNPDITFSYDNLDVSGNDIYFAAGCTHFDQTAGGTDDDGDDMNRMYVSCLDLKDDYVVLAFTSAIKSKDNSSQEACAVYKFKISSPVSLKKVSGNTGISEGNACYADLSGGKFGLYGSAADAASDKDRIAVFTTKADGTTNEVSVPAGDYYVKEIAAPKNYALNAETVKITVKGGTQSFTMADPPQNNPLDLVLIKIDKETGKAEPQGSASLAGAEFTVKYFDNESGTTSGTAKKAWVFKTDAKGEVHLKDAYKVSGDALYKNTAGYETLPVGTYSVQETKAPAGYVAVDTTPAVQVLKASGTSETFTAFVAKNVPNQIIRGGVQIKKEDTITAGTPQGDADLSGITFSITNESTHSVRVDGKDYGKGAVVKSIVTDGGGIAKTGNKDLPYGDYSIKEVKTNASYLLTDGKARIFRISEDSKIVEISEPFKNEVVRGDVEIEKLDRETDVRVPLGSATHVGTTFEITNKSKKPVVVDGKLFQAGQVCKTIKIEKEKETAKTTGRALPYGTYTIKETAVGTGYLLTDSKERTFQIREDGKTVSIGRDGDVKDPCRNQVKRGDFNFIKVFEDADSEANMSGLAHIPFEVISKTTGEKHIIVTDENGQFDSDNGWFAHSKNTNANDAAVSSDGKVDESKLTSDAGVWFGTDREGNKAKEVDDTLGALPYDTYVMNELPCKNNEGAKLIKNKTFIIRVDKRDISLGTMDDPADRSIGTLAVDGLTKDCFGSNASESIIDTVSYKGLTKGQKYTMKGALVDKATEEPVMAGGKKVTAKATFTASDTSGTVEITFTFPKEALKGKEVVAFETCETGGKVIAAHEDIEDENQTVVYPDIATEAKDGQTGNHFGLNDSTTIKDIVKYANLKPGKEYTMTGTLMDKATGKAVQDKDGAAITAKKKFTPDKKDGEVELVFEVPAGLLTGKSVVVFEHCYQEEMEIVVHADIEDEDQSVYYPDIKTEAKDEQSKTHYGFAASTKLIDTISYVNLEPGKEYTMKGILVDKVTGKAVQDEEGHEITSETTFTPAEKDGQVELTFEFPAGLLTAKTVVAFETCYREKKEIAVHADIEDADQTVYYPQIKTEAKDEQSQTHYGMNSSTKLVDTVTYSNLEPGKEYTIKGTLMEKATGKAVLSDGKEITAEKKFIPKVKDGTVELAFESPAGLLAAKTVVVFETCYREEKEIAVHADIEDANQTVYYPQIKTEAKDGQSQTHYGINSSTKIVDIVTYSNLEPGKEYTMKGTLMDKETGDAVLNDGKEITSEVKFTPGEKDGVVELVFEFPEDVLAAKTVVAFESCCREDKEVAVHADIEDENQTVCYPQIGTVLTDDKTKDHIAASDQTVKLTDTVEYKNLEPGREYTMTGRLMDKKTVKAVLSSGKEVTAKETFTPKEKDGSVKLTFTFVRKDLEGVTIVAFETAAAIVDKGEAVVAVHEDLTDEDQSVHLPKIATNAVDAGTKSHSGKVESTVKIEDKVTYQNLIPGKKYTMTGTLMDKSNGKVLKDSDGKAITATKEFTPGKADGSVTLTFKVPGKIVEGKKAVAFESCKYEGVEVAVHADINDKNQTVEYPKEKTPEKTTSKKTTSKKTTSKVSTSPKTGDNTNLAFWTGVILVSFIGAAAAVILLIRNRRKKKTMD